MRGFVGTAVAVFLLVGACAFVGLRADHARAAQPPIDGFFPLVGIAATDEFNDDFSFFPEPSGPVTGNLLGDGGTPHFDVALLDTGAGFSLFNDAGFRDFGLNDPSPGESDGYRGTEFVTIGGATGQLLAPINDPLGLYASGLQDRASAGATLTMDTSLLAGQTNTATITLPASSELPNIVGLPFASQYATRIRNDAPQVFQLDGRTIRTPAIDFLPLGSQGGGITRRAPLNLNPGSTFAQPPAYLPNIINFDIDKPQENPSTPTLSQGGLFLNVQAQNGAGSLGGTTEFFFDTGASVTVVSELNALNLGFDVVSDEPEFTISVVGSGGLLSDIPGFFVDQFTIVAFGGSLTLSNVPVIVLDVADPSDPGNVVEGIVGTNLLAGRNVVIDPVPSLGAGGPSAGVYISDPVTTDFAWASPLASDAWTAANSWSAAATPDLLSVTRLEPTGSANQVAIVAGDQEAWNLSVAGGAGGESMTVRVAPRGRLSTFSGATIEAGGTIELDFGALDTQFLDLAGGKLTGSGQVVVGSGPIVGQVLVDSGSVIAPGEHATSAFPGIGTLAIEGRLSATDEAVFAFDIGDSTPGIGSDQLDVSDSAALAGTLRVDFVPGFMPLGPTEYELITYAEEAGQFDTLELPDGFEWNVTYGPTSLRLALVGLSGDFNADGAVDAADYTVWRDGVGTLYTQADYDLWRDNYRASFPTPGTVVPEPTTACLALALLLVGRPRRCHNAAPQAAQ